MDKKQFGEMPIYMQMALAHNVSAMNAFLKLDNNSQDEIIKKARESTTKREIQQIVDKIPTMHSF